MIKYLYIVLLVCILIDPPSVSSYVPGSQCQTLSPSSVCSQLLGYSSITIHPTFSCQTDAEHALSQAPILWATLQDLIPNTISYCSSQFAVLLCQSIYRPCTMYPDNLPCQSTCQGMRLQCPPSIQLEILYPFSSAMPSPFTFTELSLQFYNLL
jgi:hypothetical protein